MRITNALRADIMHRVVNKAFGDQIEAAKKRFADAARLAFEEIYKAEIAASKNIPAELRDTMLHVCGYFYVNVLGSKVQFPVHPWSDGETELAVYNKHGYLYGGMRDKSRYRSNYIDVTPFSCPVNFLLVKNCRDELSQLYNSAAALRDQINLVLNSTMSSKKLLEMAPELEEYLPKNSIVATKAVIPMDTVNSLRAVLQGIKPQAAVSGDEEESE